MNQKKENIPSKHHNYWLASLPYLAIIGLAAYFAYRQSRTGNVIIGSDTIFHYNRFFETAQQIKHGNFSWLMSLYGYNHSGRVINAFYGPLFAYLNGLLVLTVKTWYRYQIVSSFLVFSLGGTSMYWALRKFKARRSVSTLLALLYMTIGWLPRWQIATNFSGISAAIMPFGLIVAYDLVFDREKPVHWIKLALLMSVALETHLLTAVMYIAFLLPAWIYALVKHPEKSAKQKILVETAKAVGLALLLTLNTLAPLFWLSKTNALAAPATMSMSNGALKLSHTSVWPNPHGLLGSNLRTRLTYWLFYIFLAQAIYVLWKHKDNKLNTVITLYGTFWLFLASKLLPWGNISNRLPFLARFLQFPARFTCIAYPLLMIGLALSAEGFLKKAKGKWFVYPVLVAATLVSIDSAVLYLNEAAWNGYIAGVKNNTNTQLGSKLSTYLSKKERKKLSDQARKKVKEERVKALKQANAQTHTEDLSAFLTVTQKSVADYLPIYKQDPKPVINGWAEGYKKKEYVKKQTQKAERAYRKSVLSQKLRKQVKVKTIKGGLKITWKSKQGKAQRLPVVTYRQSNLVVNGKTLTSYQRNRIGAPKVASKVGKNVAYLTFNEPVLMKLIVFLSLLAWPGLLVLLAFFLVKNKTEKANK